MKKLSIIIGLISFGLMLIWVLCALFYCAFNDFPKTMPHAWNLALSIPFVIFLICCITFLICMRNFIITEIKQLLKDLN